MAPSRKALHVIMWHRLVLYFLLSHRSKHFWAVVTLLSYLTNTMHLTHCHQVVQCVNVIKTDLLPDIANNIERAY
jgi:hypothetical protein